MNKSLVLVFLFTILFITVGCSKPYDFTGSFSATEGVDCEEQPGDNTFVTITSSQKGGYKAALSSHLSGGGIFPLLSNDFTQNNKESVTFFFYKEGKTGFFSSKPVIDMSMTFVKKDGRHIILESWPVQASAHNDPTRTGGFDFIQDTHIQMLGQEHPNDLYNMAGKDGLCLKRNAQ